MNKFLDRVFHLLFCSLVSVVFISCSEGTVFNSYDASEDAVAVLKAENHEGITIDVSRNGYALYPDVYTEGFIFYPGGKVECEAYLPLAKQLAEKGCLVIIPRMFGDLAIFNIDAADSFFYKYQSVQNWYIGGHSLGGAMAGEYASKNSRKIKGLILLAAYSQKKISENMKVLTVYGSRDGVLNNVKYLKCKSNLPEGFTEFIIEGGCHAFFGNYGFQNGDGDPEITREEQQKITVDLILDFMGIDS